MEPPSGKQIGVVPRFAFQSLPRRLIRRIPLAAKLYGWYRRMRRLWGETHRVWNLWRSPNFRFINHYQPGHYYSPIPDYGELVASEKSLVDRARQEVPAVFMDVQAQIELLEQLARYYPELPFGETPSEKTRFYLDNEYFGYGDSIVLYAILRHYQPGKGIEIGSGFSSALMLDVSDGYFAGALDLTFIEPHPHRLLSLLRAGDRERCRILTKPVQQVPAAIFAALGENDVLFVDSSHVVKVGSDVVYIVSTLLPSLRRGVLVHFHDVLWPFEYPHPWFASGRAWNEVYLLKAFLQYNASFEIVYFNSFLETQYPELVRARMPLAMKEPSSSLTVRGSSLWLRKVG